MLNSRKIEDKTAVVVRYNRETFKTLPVACARRDEKEKQQERNEEKKENAHNLETGYKVDKQKREGKNVLIPFADTIRRLDLPIT